MGLFGPGRNTGASAEQRADRQTAAKITDAGKRGTNLVRVADVKQRHSTGTGKNGTTIKGRLHTGE